MKEFLTALCLLSGTFFVLVSAIGVVRLPDVYCRSHALGKATTLGITLLLLGLSLQVAETGAAFKIALAIVFQFLTIPTASHLLVATAARHNKRSLPQKGRAEKD